MEITKIPCIVTSNLLTQIKLMQHETCHSQKILNGTTGFCPLHLYLNINAHVKFYDKNDGVHQGPHVHTGDSNKRRSNKELRNLQLLLF